MVKALKAEVHKKTKSQIASLFGLRVSFNPEVYRTTGENFIEESF